MKALITVLVCLVAAVLFWLLRKPRAIDQSLASYAGKIEDYRGDKKLIVAFTAPWASVWKLTEAELGKLDRTRFELCIVDAAVDREIVKTLRIDFFPTVARVENGKTTKRIQNLTKIDQLKDW